MKEGKTTFPIRIKSGSASVSIYDRSDAYPYYRVAHYVGSQRQMKPFYPVGGCAASGAPNRRADQRAREAVAPLGLALDTAAIELAQLNRSIENDNNRSPRLSDLRESGSIEADSDVVIFIHREKKGVFIDSRMLCQIVVGKNRNGSQGVFDLCFDRDVCRFEDWRKHQDLVAEAEKLRS
jgi:hypothetical protein